MPDSHQQAVKDRSALQLAAMLASGLADAVDTTDRTLAGIEAYALHRERLAGADAERMDRRVVTRMKLAATMSMSDYLALRHARSSRRPP
jgi:hypothetical protein